MKAKFPLFPAARSLGVVAFGVVAFAAGSVLAGAWTQKKGEGHVITTGTFTRSGRAFDADGDAVPIPRYDKLEVNVLVEYGVTDWLTAIVQPQLLGVDIAAPANADTFGPGYTDIGARARLWSSTDSVFSLQAFGRIPGRNDETNLAEIGNTDAEFDIRRTRSAPISRSGSGRTRS
jgi:hypothetical protein